MATWENKKLESFMAVEFLIRQKIVYFMVCA